jgi:TRAP transporter TAXI family solute receptor
MTVVLALSLFLIAQVPASAQEKDWPRSIKCSGGSPGSNYYATNSAVAAISTKFLKVQAAPSAAPGGSGVSTKAVGLGEAEIGTTASSYADDALWGKGGFEGKPMPIRAILQGRINTWGFFAPAKLGINNIKDIKGQTTGLRFAGGKLSLQVTDALLNAAGLKPGDIRDVKQTGIKSHIESLKEGRIKVGCHIGGPGTALYKELFLSKDMRMISLTPAQQNQMIKELGWAIPYTMPAGTYKGMDQDANMIGFLAYIIGRADLPDSYVYELVKAIFENFDEFTGFHPGLKDYSAEKVNLVNIPHHPGAIKYYKEVGTWTPELEARNQAWLKKLGATK